MFQVQYEETEMILKVSGFQGNFSGFFTKTEQLLKCDVKCIRACQYLLNQRESEMLMAGGGLVSVVKSIFDSKSISGFLFPLSKMTKQVRKIVGNCRIDS